MGRYLYVQTNDANILQTASMQSTMTCSSVAAM